MFINFKINYSRAKNIYISKQKVVCMVEKKVNKKSKVIITILSFIFFIIRVVLGVAVFCSFMIMIKNYHPRAR